MSRINFREAHPKNFQKGRTKPKQYIVIHYTANNGDTAAGNANYFNRTVTETSAHYFVDEGSEIWQTVQDEDTAWHCGTKGEYRHPLCRNANSIGIEMCSRKDELGRYYIKGETVDNTVELVKELMLKYDIPKENVLRHYDVTGKICPAPFVEDEGLWREFQKRLTSEHADLSTDAQPEQKSTIKFNFFGEKTIDISGFNIDGVIYVGVRELLEAIGCLVVWNDETKTVCTRKKALFQITNDDLIILEKIVQAEAGGEDDHGKLLVANVILNRVKMPGFPDNIKDVVFDPMQFEPTRNSAYEKAVPSQATKKAVQQALCGVDYSQTACFFRSVKGATAECWHEKALTFLFQHGGHRFYK